MLTRSQAKASQSNATPARPVGPNPPRKTILDVRPGPRVAAVESKSAAASAGPSGGDGVDEPKKKRKKKKSNLSKEERQLRRDAKRYEDLYRSKDSHVQMISAAVLQKLNNSASSQQPKTRPASFAPDDFPAVISSPVKNSIAEFQSLSPQTSTKSEVKKSVPNAVRTGNVPVQSHQSLAQGEGKSPVKETRRSFADAPVKPLEDDESEWETENEGCGEKAEKRIPEPIILGTPVPETGSKRKSKAPLLVSLDVLMTTKKTPEKRKEEVRKSKESRQSLEKKTVGNLLDSSGPGLMNRGKIRDRTKKKKVSTLKKNILISRSLRKSNQGAQSTTQAEAGNENVPDYSSSDTSANSSGPETSGTASDTTLEMQTPISSTKPLSTPTPNSVTDTQATAVTEITESADPGNSDEQKSSPSLISLHTKSVDDLIDHSTSSPCKNDENILVKLLDTAIQEQASTKISSNLVQEPQPQQQSEPEINAGVDPEIFAQAKKSLHNRKFRDYCNMYTSKELHGHVIALTKELHRFQDRLYHSDPVKYQTKKRYVIGLKDALSYLKINKVVLVILAPDIEPTKNVQGGLDDKVSEIINLANDKKVPIVISGSRFVLGKAMFIKAPVSAIAVLDKQGAESLFQTVIEEASKLRAKYEEDLQNKINQLSISTPKL